MYSIKEFCTLTKLSRSALTALRQKGDGPVITKLGGKLLISEENARRWLKEHEQPRGREAVAA